jgi:uncharacterized protein YceH (UPF0502 family)
MTTPPPGSTPPTPSAARWKPLDARQRRVLGVLLEKAVNAIVTGCNQKNNRDPLTQYDDIDVEKALDELRQLGVVSEIDWMGRVSKYKHHAYEWLGVSRAESAVMTELLLRGAQQLGELRGRAARMEAIPDLGALKPIVDGLVERGLMLELTPPGRGQIVSHGLYLPAELQELRSRHTGHPWHPEGATHDGSAEGSAPRTGAAASAHGAHASSPEWDALWEEVAALRAEVAELRARLSALESRTT